LPESCPEDRKYSVIIPTLNEEQWIGPVIRHVRALNSRAEIIVSDGGSSDGTLQLASMEAVRIVQSARGRGRQLNAGAKTASGEIFLFLHADSMFPSNAFRLLQTFFNQPRVEAGTFRLRFDEPHWILRAYSFFTRFDSIFTRFGDQCIAVRRKVFEEIGGFPDWPLFEDVHFLRMLRTRTRIYSFPACVTTSARRFVRMGLIRTQWMNVKLFSRYLLGTDPTLLNEEYSFQPPRIPLLPKEG